MLHRFAEIASEDPAVSGVLYFGGAGGGNATENIGRMFIQLKPHDERNVTSDDVIRRLRPKMAQVEGAKFFMQSGQDISVGGRLSRTQYQYTLTDTDYDELNHWAPIVEAAMRKLPELQDVASDQQIAAPYMGIEIDRDAASRLGISLSLVDETLYDAFGQRQVATMYTSTNQYKVILGVKPEFQKDLTALSKIYVPGRNGAQVPLSTIAHYKSSVEPLMVSHQGQFPAVTLSFNLAPNVAIGQAVDKIHELERELRMPATLSGSFQGTAQAFQASLQSTPLLVAAAILVVYIVLGVLYESYIHPVTILSSLPSAGVGALLALMLLGYDLSVIAMIGVILLIGIVKKNAIMMIDFALQAERNEGKSPLEAIHEACLLRFRPIMMTTFAALFGAMPIAFGGGAGSELRRPLGVAMVGGLLVSQWLTLYTTPVVYLYLDRLARFLGASTRPSRLAEAVGAGPGPGWRTSRAARPNDCGPRRWLMMRRSVRRKMCGRVVQKTPLAEIRVLFETVNPVPNMAATYNGAPTQNLAVVRLDADGTPLARSAALGADPVLGQGQIDRAAPDQRDGRDRRDETGVPRRLPPPPLPRAGRFLLRVAEDRKRQAAQRQAARRQAALCDRSRRRCADGAGRVMGTLEGPGRRRDAA